MTEEFLKYFVDNTTKLISVASAIILSLAVSFDVGFFYGVDINMFTLFSISEHVLFSLQWLPLSIFFFVAALFIVFFIALDLITSKIVKNSSVYKYRPFIMFLCALIVVGLAYLIYATRSAMSIIISSVLTGGCFIVGLVINSPRIDYVRKIFISSATIYTMTIVCAFLFGYMFGRLSTQEIEAFNHIIVTKGGRELSASIVRSGDRGILFVTPDSERVFLKWEMLDGVRRIRAKNNSDDLKKEKAKAD